MTENQEIHLEYLLETNFDFQIFNALINVLLTEGLNQDQPEYELSEVKNDDENDYNDNEDQPSEKVFVLSIIALTEDIANTIDRLVAGFSNIRSKQRYELSKILGKSETVTLSFNRKNFYSLLGEIGNDIDVSSTAVGNISKLKIGALFIPDENDPDQGKVILDYAMLYLFFSSNVDEFKERFIALAVNKYGLKEKEVVTTNLKGIGPAIYPKMQAIMQEFIRRLENNQLLN